ncbi:MAG: DUF6701 domain-containing protein, partial [Salinivenus sp.]
MVSIMSSDGAYRVVFRSAHLVATLLLAVTGLAHAQEGPLIGTGSGLTGNYCNRTFFDYEEPCTDEPDVTRVDRTVEFSNGDDGWPPDDIGEEYFSVRWTGEIQAQYSEDYTFHALHDDGVRIWVDGERVIDQYEDQAAAWTDSDNPIALERGERYDIVIEYYERTVDQDMTLAWSSDSTDRRTTVPESQLYPEGSETDPDADLLLNLRMDEQDWNGSAGEVEDASGNGNDGTARNGAEPDDSSPAKDDDPGTCGYGTFDGTDQYVEVDGLSDQLDGTATLTFWIRTTQDGNNTPWEAPGVTGVEEGGGTDDIFWGWIDGSGRIGVSVGNDYGDDQKSKEAVNDGVWHHVALTRDADSGDTRVYVDGDLENEGSTDTGTIGNAFDSIGRIEDTANTPVHLNGELDEVRVYDAPLSESEVEDISDSTHPCPEDDDNIDECPAQFAVYTETGLDVDSTVQVNNNDVTGTGNAVDPETGERSNENLSLNSFEPSEFPEFSKSENRKVARGSSETIEAGEYGQIRVNQDASARFETDNGAFYIEELRADRDATITLEPGRYFIDALRLDQGATLNATGAEPVEIFINGEFRAGRNASINSDGDASDLMLRYYEDADMRLIRDSEMRATHYAPESTREFHIERDSVVHGGIYTGGSARFDRDVDIFYGDDEQQAGAELAECVTEEVDYYVVSAPTQGLTCFASEVTIEARDADDEPIEPDSDTTLALSTDTGRGTWSRVRSGSGTLTDDTTGDGSGSYTFPGDESAVQLSFDYPELDGDREDVIVSADDGEASGASDPLTISRAGFRFLDDDDGTADDVISSQISGKPSDEGSGASTIGLQAVRARDDDPTECEGVFDEGEEVSVDIGAECRDPDTCAGKALSVNDTDISTSDDNGESGQSDAYSTVDLEFGAESTAPLVLNYPDAGAMRLYAEREILLDDDEETGSGEYLVGESNSFVWRPFGFDVDAGDDDSAVGPGQSVFADAGEDFELTLRAVTWASGDEDDSGQPDADANLSDNATTPNFGAESTPPEVDLQPRLVEPADGRDGTLSVRTFDEFADGEQTESLNWDEVGFVDISADLSDYLDAGDVTGTGRDIGRFIPDNFVQTVEQIGEFEHTCTGAFTYTGQEFAYTMEPVLRIEARNEQGNITRNYRDDYAKLVPGDVARTPPDTDESQLGNDDTPLAVDADVSSNGTLELADG